MYDSCLILAQETKLYAELHTIFIN